MTTLDLADKSISTLKRVNFLNLTMLIELDLDGNLIASLPDGIFEELTMLTSLYLNSNALTCTGGNYTTWSISSTVNRASTFVFGCS